MARITFLRFARFRSIPRRRIVLSKVLYKNFSKAVEMTQHAFAMRCDCVRLAKFAAFMQRSLTLQMVRKALIHMGLRRMAETARVQSHAAIVDRLSMRAQCERECVRALNRAHVHALLSGVGVFSVVLV
jgi:hypothetical protein